MKRTLLLAITGFSLTAVSFITTSGLHWMLKSKRQFDQYTLTDYYFTLDSNINNKNSVAYIANKPTLDNIEKAALTMPSDSFTITKNQQVLLSVKLVHAPERKFIIINPATKQEKSAPCSFQGDMTAIRAIEIAGNHYDNHSSLIDGYLYFNHKKFKTVEHAAIENEVMRLAEAELK